MRCLFSGWFLQDVHDGSYDRGLAHAGSARDDEHLRDQGLSHGVTLSRSQTDVQSVFRLVDRLFNVVNAPLGRAFAERRQVGGNRLLGVVEVLQVDRLGVGRRGLHQPSLLYLVINRLREKIVSLILFKVQKLACGRLQRLAREAAVPGHLGGGLECRKNACADSEGRILLCSRLERNVVCGDEADAVDLARHPVRVLSDDLQGISSVLFVDLRCLSSGHAVTGKKDHDFADVALLVSVSGELLDALRAESSDFLESLGFVLQNIEDRKSEGVHQAFGEPVTDPRDDSRSQIALDAQQALGKRTRNQNGCKLAPPLRIVLHASLDTNVEVGREDEVWIADDLPLPTLLVAHHEDAVGAGFALKDDPYNATFDGLHGARNDGLLLACHREISGCG